MEVISKARVEYDRRFIAFDGTEFDAEYKCVEYERDLLIKKCQKKLRYIDGGRELLPPDGEEHGNENTYHWFYPEDRDDIELLNETWDSSGGFANNDINTWVCVEEQWGGDCWYTNLDYCMDYVTRFFKEFGYNVKFE